MTGGENGSIKATEIAKRCKIPYKALARHIERYGWLDEKKMIESSVSVPIMEQHSKIIHEIFQRERLDISTIKFKKYQLLKVMITKAIKSDDWGKMKDVMKLIDLRELTEIESKIDHKFQIEQPKTIDVEAEALDDLTEDELRELVEKKDGK